MPDEPKKQRSIIFEIALYTLIAFAIVIPVRTFVVQPFIVNGTSMEPTFEPEDYLVIDELSYRFREPQRGDVIIFRYPLEPTTFFVKRIIGMPNETVLVRDGVIVIQGRDGSEEVLNEPYVVGQTTKSKVLATELDDDEYFVMGDNRKASSDSRVWGQLQKRFIVGRALMRLYPFEGVTLYPGDYSFDTDDTER